MAFPIAPPAPPAKAPSGPAEEPSVAPPMAPPSAPPAAAFSVAPLPKMSSTQVAMSPSSFRIGRKDLVAVLRYHAHRAREPEDLARERHRDAPEGRLVERRDRQELSKLVTAVLERERADARAVAVVVERVAERDPIVVADHGRERDPPLGRHANDPHAHAVDVEQGEALALAGAGEARVHPLLDELEAHAGRVKQQPCPRPNTRKQRKSAHARLDCFEAPGSRTEPRYARSTAL